MIDDTAGSKRSLLAQAKSASLVNRPDALSLQRRNAGRTSDNCGSAAISVVELTIVIRLKNTHTLSCQSPSKDKGDRTKRKANRHHSTARLG